MTTVQNNIITFVITCADGSCLCKIVNNHIFPIPSIVHTLSWRQEGSTLTKQVCGLDLTTFNLHRWFKILIPSDTNNSYITSFIFKTRLVVEQKRKCKLAAGYAWIYPNDMVKHQSNATIGSTVLLDFFPRTKDLINYKNYSDELWEVGIMIEVTAGSLLWKNYAPAEQHVNGSVIIPVQNAIFHDFYSSCLPSILMSKFHFMAFMKKFAISDSWLAHLFRAADLQDLGFLSYRDIAKILVLIDPETEHAKQAAEMRKKYLFQMFDRDRDSFLVKDDLEALIELVRQPNDFDIRTCLIAMKMNQSGKKMAFEDFTKSIDTLLPAGLSACMRACRTCRSIYADAKSPSGKTITDSTINFGARYRMQLEKRKEFIISSHTLHVMKSKNIINIVNVWNLKDICSYDTLRQAGITKDLRKFSCEINSPALIFNEQLTNLRYLTHLNKINVGKGVSYAEDFEWGSLDATAFGNRLIKICASTKKLLMDEARLLELKAPVYVIGSVHGNISDLTSFEKILWPRTPGHSPGSILFLGSYVDRSPFGIEVVTLLFCYKCMFPKKMYLLRGSHELRKVQIKDCFRRECLQKFGSTLGFQVWDAVNEAFDCLPVAAVVDDKILCVHSGIPQPIVCTLTKFFNNVPCPLSDPEKTCELVWELLWNEPGLKCCKLK
ncbi:uncharacterized protein [Atheta coriaria]|uniref:uncharacterized protein isoform X2 n=1 Tax=Dalotia coriaria TaxID=877792 RepID=UPI0031F34360